MTNKRIISFIIAIVLLICCFALNFVNNGIVTVGTGMGFDTRIEDATALADILEYLGEFDLSKQVASNNSEGIVLLSESEEEENLEEDAAKTKYTGATIVITTSTTSSSSSDTPYYTTNKLVKSEQTLNRELTMYITNDATYYISRGSSTASAKYYDKADVNTYIRFDCEAYTTATSEYVKFHDLFISTTEETIQLKANTAEQWIKVPQDTVGSIIGADSENRQVLSSIGMLVDVLVEHDMIEGGTSARFNEDDFISLIEQSGDEVPSSLEDGKIDFTVDLTNATSPRISSIAVVDSVDEQIVVTGYNDFYNPITTTVRITNKRNVIQELTIKHINNTVINFDESRDILEVASGKEFEKLFIIEEVESDD